MIRNITLIIIGISLLFSCKKEEKNPKYPIQYKLSGKYYRDSTIKSDGYKILNLREDGNYCWTRVIDGLDSNFCFGTYEQTSDTSMIWDKSTPIYFKITPIDTITKGIQLQVYSSPAMAALYGYYQ
ncbi:MAG: hypothetical protein CFE21_08960 [Bacteroidetes bacterium B1(2017)]|nr:MAG: hypothetical protein CFE21_08960 [Bacteroidetes bacterium B1(2017)]